jgi:hypothetical protein
VARRFYDEENDMTSTLDLRDFVEGAAPGSVASSLPTTAHPLHIIFANMFGAFFCMRRQCDRTLGVAPGSGDYVLPAASRDPTIRVSLNLNFTGVTHNLGQLLRLL